MSAPEILVDLNDNELRLRNEILGDGGIPNIVDLCTDVTNSTNDRLNETGAGDATRCERHPGRNPCAIDGCKRSSKARPDWSGNDLWLCGEHWRGFVPPRSPERRVYHRIWRNAKRYGWTPARERAFWRIWNRIVARARSRAAGDVDMREVNRLMGWD